MLFSAHLIASRENFIQVTREYVLAVRHREIKPVSSDAFQDTFLQFKFSSWKTLDSTLARPNSFSSKTLFHLEPLYLGQIKYWQWDSGIFIDSKELFSDCILVILCSSQLVSLYHLSPDQTSLSDFQEVVKQKLSKEDHAVLIIPDFLQPWIHAHAGKNRLWFYAESGFPYNFLLGQYGVASIAFGDQDPQASIQVRSWSELGVRWESSL